MRIAIIGTYPPRQCGIATYTQDLYKSIAATGKSHVGIIAVSDGSEEHYPSEVEYVIQQHNIESYFHAITFINKNYDVCIIQHEYGIYGGKSGGHILFVAKQLNIPVIGNLHTVVTAPSPEEQRILTQLGSFCQKLTVMTSCATKLLNEIYGIRQNKVQVIPHGVPQLKLNQQQAKQKLGLLSKKVMLSFGFLGPGKGFETAIEAVSSVHHPDFVYIILGSTHPNIIKESGEAYRQYLYKLVESKNISDQVIFIDKFADEELLLTYLSACDIYVTPYPNAHQISSGTLSFAIGAGAAVLSTPYSYAKDLLADDRGLLFDFKDALGLADLINQLVDYPMVLAQYRNNAFTYGQTMQWSKIAQTHLALAQKLVDQQKSKAGTVSLSIDNVSLDAAWTTLQTQQLNNLITR